MSNLAGTKSGSTGGWSCSWGGGLHHLWLSLPNIIFLKEQPTGVLVIGEESKPPAKNEKKESKKLTAWCGCSCSAAPISLLFLGAELASDSSRDRRSASSLIAVSVIIWQLKLTKGTVGQPLEQQNPHIFEILIRIFIGKKCSNLFFYVYWST